MAEQSAIAWTRSTFNPWIGCTKVGPGCDHCYAEVSTPSRSMGIKWGAGEPRKRTTPHTWNGPLKWNKRAGEERASGRITSGWESWPRPGFWPVFSASLADVFDNEVPDHWRSDLWDLIERTPNLSWLLVTKRIGNAVRMLRTHDWAARENVRVLISVVNQEEADRDIPKLLALRCKNGISYEPALGPVDWSRWLGPQCDNGSVPGPGGVGGRPRPRCMGSMGTSRGVVGCPGLEWVIVGGESSQGGHKARPFDIAWARSTVAQCKAAGVPVFVKQLGGNTPGWCFGNRPEGTNDDCNVDCQSWESGEGGQCPEGVCAMRLDRAGADQEEWPEDLRVREFPE